MSCLLRVVACTTVAVSACSASVAAEDEVARYLSSQLGTVSAEATPQFADGKLYACIVEFANLSRDWAYRQGGFIRVGGSFGIMSSGGKMGATLKVTVHDIETPSMTMTPSAPANAYLFSGMQTTTSSRVASYPSDTPGTIFVVFQSDPALSMILKGLGANQVNIGFNRKKDGADIRVAIDTSVEALEDGSKKPSTKTATQFLECAKSLVEATP